MAIMDLYIDESGTTGSNLLPGSACTFVIAANNLSDQAAINLRDSAFPGLIAELKYAELKRSHEREVVSMLTRLSQTPDCFGFYSVNKPYMLLLILIDIWIGQSDYQRQLDFYKHGNNIDFARRMYEQLHSADNQKQFYKLLEGFQAIITRSDLDKYRSFWAALANFSDVPEVQQLLDAEKRLGPDFYMQLLDNSNEKGTLSLHLTALTRLIEFWQDRLPGTDFLLHHDDSSEMHRLRELWALRCAPSSPSTAILLNAALRGPLPVVNSSFKEDSEMSIQIQISDVIAGAAADYLNARLESNFKFTDYHRQLFHTGFFNANAGGVLPTTG